MDAYGIIPVHPSEHSKLGICFQDKYYFDKCLAYHPEANYLHMLDDSFLMQNGARLGKRDLEHYIEFCDDIGVPWEPSMTIHPSTNTVFLGVELGTIKYVLIKK